MPFIRHTRDKRGYETTYVMHAYRPVQGPQRTRVLYLFRSPSHLKMGRQSLDEEIREALEHTHPDVSFDWSVLGRESAMARDDSRDRERDRDRDRGRGPRGGGRPGPPRAPAPQAAPAPVVMEDQSVLGRAAGAERAARLRAQYGELLQRIARRSRTPEDRERLTQQAQRLNPDDWADEAEARSRLDGIQAEWDAVVAELPARRRGRRGGRRRDRPDGTAAPHDARSAAAGADEPSGIMDDGGDVDSQTDSAEMDRPDRDADDHRDDGGRRPEGDGADEPASDDIPGDD